MSDPSRPGERRLPTYTARLSAIRSILARHLPIDAMVQNNRVANPIEPLDCLAASWGETVTAVPAVVLSVHHVDDFTEEVDLLRHIADGEPGSYEVPRERSDEYALVQGDLGAVQAVVRDCAVRIGHRGVELSDLIAPAVEVAGALGWTPYVDDYAPPPLPPGADAPIWTI